MKFIVSSYNIGSSVSDYLNYYPSQFRSTEFSGNSDVQTTNFERSEIEERYYRVREVSASRFAGSADVYCLQEVMESERPELRNLIEHNYEILRSSSRSDTAVAISRDKFESINNLSFTIFSGNDVAGGTAIERATGLTYAFFSAHIGGFPLESASQEQMQEAAEPGDNDCESIAEKLNEIFKGCEALILGGDFNAIPVRYQRRFDIFENNGFVRKQTHLPTNRTTNPLFAQTLFDRELDFFEIRQKTSSFLAKIPFISSLFNPATPHFEICEGKFQPGLNPEYNASDHIPIYLQVALPIE